MWSRTARKGEGCCIPPIPGTTRVAHLEEDVAATRIALDEDDLARLDGRVAGMGRRAHARDDG